MLNPQFEKFRKLKGELEHLKTLCPQQYFIQNKCKHNCGKRHVDRSQYPCLYFYLGHCKYGYKCLFRHSLKRNIIRQQPSDVCRAYFNYGLCYNKQNCKYSHDLRGQPCIWNSNGGCKYSALECRYSHELKAEPAIPCFFHMMGKCMNDDCKHIHTAYLTRSITYEGV